MARSIAHPSSGARIKTPAWGYFTEGPLERGGNHRGMHCNCIHMQAASPSSSHYRTVLMPGRVKCSRSELALCLGPWRERWTMIKGFDRGMFVLQLPPYMQVASPSSTCCTNAKAGQPFHRRLTLSVLCASGHGKREMRTPTETSFGGWRSLSRGSPQVYTPNDIIQRVAERIEARNGLDG